MNWPNFLVIGAARSGTTTLHHYLRKHPQVFMPIVKEPGFFIFDGEEPNYLGPRVETFFGHGLLNSAEEYGALFDNAQNADAVGEASALYLYFHDRTAERIHRYNPDTRLIAILRHPADRAFSNYMYLRMSEREPVETFEEALALESQRKMDGWYPFWFYREQGFYHTQLATFYQVFPRQQIKVFLFEDLKNRSAELLQELYGFLGVSPDYVPETVSKHNNSGEVTNRFSKEALNFIDDPSHPLKRLTHRIPETIRKPVREKVRSLIKRQGVKEAAIAPETRQSLLDDYRDDILQTQDLIQRDLSAWLV